MFSSTINPGPNKNCVWISLTGWPFGTNVEFNSWRMPFVVSPIGMDTKGEEKLMKLCAIRGLVKLTLIGPVVGIEIAPLFEWEDIRPWVIYVLGESTGAPPEVTVSPKIGYTVDVLHDQITFHSAFPLCDEAMVVVVDPERFEEQISELAANVLGVVSKEISSEVIAQICIKPYSLQLKTLGPVMLIPLIPRTRVDQMCHSIAKAAGLPFFEYVGEIEV